MAYFIIYIRLIFYILSNKPENPFQIFQINYDLGKMVRKYWLLYNAITYSSFPTKTQKCNEVEITQLPINIWMK